MGVTVPEKFRGRARRDAAAFYLAQLARGILGGEIVATAGEQQTVLATAEFVVLEIEVEQKKRVNQVSMKVRWPRRPVIRAAVGGGPDGRP